MSYGSICWLLLALFDDIFTLILAVSPYFDQRERRFHVSGFEKTLRFPLSSPRAMWQDGTLYQSGQYRASQLVGRRERGGLTFPNSVFGGGS